MKANRILFMMAAVGAVITLLGSTAQAQKEWYTCAVDRAVDGMNTSYLKLTSVDGDLGFALKWFRLPEEQKTQMIAKATAAVSNLQEVCVNTDINKGIFPEIHDIYVKPKEEAKPLQNENWFLTACQVLHRKGSALCGTLAHASFNPY